MVFLHLCEKILNRPDGRKYEGNWKMGKKEGRGKFTSVEGIVTEGYWRDDNFTGNGLNKDE